MLIIPSIDLFQGRCVRLKQGQFNHMVFYDPNPESLAQHYLNLGLRRLHLVDLEACQVGSSQQIKVLHELQVFNLSLQWGGGLRDLTSIEKTLELGASFAVIGSLAISQPEVLKSFMKKIEASRLILALDVYLEEKIPYLVTQGWQEKTRLCLWDLLDSYEETGLKTILCTDIHRDGLLMGPNFSLYAEGLRRFPQFSWQASGGVSGLDDLKHLASLGIDAAILGRLLYEPEFNLEACLRSLEDAS